MFSSLVNAASVLRGSRHWQRLQGAAAEAVAQSQSDRHSCPNVCLDQALALHFQGDTGQTCQGLFVSVRFGSILRKMCPLFISQPTVSPALM